MVADPSSRAGDPSPPYLEASVDYHQLRPGVILHWGSLSSNLHAPENRRYSFSPLPQEAPTRAPEWRCSRHRRSYRREDFTRPHSLSACHSRSRHCRSGSLAMSRRARVLLSKRPGQCSRSLRKVLLRRIRGSAASDAGTVRLNRGVSSFADDAAFVDIARPALAEALAPLRGTPFLIVGTPAAARALLTARSLRAAPDELERRLRRAAAGD